MMSALHEMTDFVARTPQELGAILHGYRRERQLTQLEVGTRCGLPQSALDVEIVVRPRNLAGQKAGG